MQKVKIELTSEDAQLFKLFQQYQDEFRILIEKHNNMPNVFELRNGRATIHKDHDGNIGVIEVTGRPYNRNKK